MALVSVLLTTVALVVAWILFRLERGAARRRDIAAAKATLIAVKRGVLEGMPELGLTFQGWGSVYFSVVYDVRAALDRGVEARTLVERGGSYQVYPVPSEPLELLSTSPSGGELISEETVFAANFALWRVAVFNHLVDKQTRFNERHAAEIADPSISAARRSVIARAAEELNIGLHLDGIGEAAKEDGWWTRLTRAVEENIAALEQANRERWWQRADERHLLIGDGLAAILLCFALGLAAGSIIS